MADNNKTFTLIGRFDDQITKKLEGVNKQFAALIKSVGVFDKSIVQLSKDFNNLSKSIDNTGTTATKSFNKMTSSLEDAGKAAGKTATAVSRIGEDTKSLDSIASSLEDAGRAAGRAQTQVDGIGESAGRANRQANDLMTTLLKAEGLSKFGDAMASGFERGMGSIMGTAAKGAGMVGKLFKDSMEDELADIKAASGIQGSFGLAGFKGDFKDSQKMYKKYDQVVSEMIRQSSAPTAKVVELQRYTLDTMGPLMLAAQGVKKGTAMKNIDPKLLTKSAQQYGAFLEKAALFSQGTGSAGFRVAAGIEGLVTRGKIDTTIDFFSDNIMLMKNLEKAGFAGRGMRSAKMMTATDAERMAAMMKAFNESMSGESTKAMASSLTGALQGLNDTIFNPSVGILGMSTTFGKKEQQIANASINKIYSARIKKYQEDLKYATKGSEREKQLRANIEQATLTRDQLIKNGADEISTPFKAFSFAFSRLVQSLTGAMNAIGPVWNTLSIALIDVTEKVFGPLGETLNNVASDMRSGKVTKTEGFGRIIGEIFKTFGEIMGDLATMLTDPKGAMGKVQSEFMKGFMAAFKEPGSFEKAKKQLWAGVWAFINKLKEILLSILSAPEMRPFVLGALALAFGPPFVSAVIAGATPLLIAAIGKIAMGMVGAAPATGARAGLGGGGGFFSTPASAAAARRARAGVRGIGGFGMGLAGLGYGLAGRPGLRVARGIGGAAQGVAGAVRGVGRFVPGGALAFGALDAGMRMASGENPGTAIGKAASATIGASLGAFLGQVLIPVPGLGAAIGGIAGGIVGDKVGSALFDSIDAQEKAAQAQAQAATVMEASNKAAAAKYTDAKSLGGVEAINRRFGGGAGLSKALEDPAKLKEMGLTKPEDITKAKEIAAQMTQLNTAASKTKTAQDAYSASVANNTRDQEKNRLALVAAQKQQRTMEAAMKVTWESANLTAQQKLLSSAGALADALNAAANKLKPNLNPYGAIPDPTQKPTSRSSNPYQGTRTRWAGSPGLGMDLGAAIKEEMAHKPPGSKLVIANSSETIIPAFKGLNLGGMAAGLDRFTAGANALSGLADLAGGAGGGAITGNLIEVGKNCWPWAYKSE